MTTSQLSTTPRKPGAVRRDGLPGIALAVIAACQLKAAFEKTQTLPAPWGHEVLAHGISTAFIAAVALVALALVTAVFVVRVRKSDLEALSGTAGAPAG